MDDVIAGGEKGREGEKKVEGVDVVVGVVTGEQLKRGGLW